jgi:hypothetical protein
MIGESTLRHAQGDNCHGELVEPWIARSSRAMTIGGEEFYAMFRLCYAQWFHRREAIILLLESTPVFPIIFLI